MSKGIKKKQQIPLFISKLMRMLQDEDMESFIKWVGPSNFSISNIPLFTQNVLPKYFKHKNFSSFVRQLNMYGFTKSRIDEGHTYHHPYFRKNDSESIGMIERKISMLQPQTEQSEKKLAMKFEIQKAMKKTKKIQKNLKKILEDQVSLLNQQKKLKHIVKKEETENANIIALFHSVTDSKAVLQNKKQILLQSDRQEQRRNENFELLNNSSRMQPFESDNSYIPLNEFADIESSFVWNNQLGLDK